MVDNNEKWGLMHLGPEEKSLEKLGKGLLHYTAACGLVVL